MIWRRSWKKTQGKNRRQPLPAAHELIKQNQKYRQHYDAATVLIEESKAESAITELQSAAEIARSISDPHRVGKAELMLSGAYHALGTVGDEESRLKRLHAERAEAAFRSANDRDGLIDSLSWLSVLFSESGDSLNLLYTLEKLDDIDPKVADWFRKYTSGVALNHRDPRRASRLLRDAINSANDLPRPEHWQEQARQKLAIVTGQEEPARPGEVAAAQSPASWVKPFTDAWQAQAGAGSDDVVEGKFDEAIEAAERMRRTIRSDVKQRELSQSMTPMYLAKASIADRDGRYEEALDTLELNTSRSLLSLAALRFLWEQSPQQSWQQLANTGAQIQDAFVRLTQSPERGEGQLRLALKRRRQAEHQVQEQLVRVVPPPHDVFLPGRTSLLREELATDDLVVFFSGQGDVYAVQKKGVSKVTRIDMDSIEDACIRYRALASFDEGSAPDSELAQVEARIAKACLEPLEPLLGEVSRVLLVPSGKLWGVPLAAIGPRPLADSHEVGIVPSLTLAASLLKTPRPPRRVERFVGVGNPDETLPGAAEEVERVAGYFDDRSVQTGKAVDLSVFILFSDADVIHLACHGVAFADYPELSFLHIAGASEAPSLWFASEVIRVAMSPRIVVLSACDAGTSTELPGNEYVGFPGVFLIAGARTVVAPLWSIPDESTTVLMDAFHRELQHASPSRALRNAQRAAQANTEIAHPFHWAAFQVFGLP